MLNKKSTLLHVEILMVVCKKQTKKKTFFSAFVEYFSCWTRLCVNDNALYFTFVCFSFSLSCCRFEQPKCDGNARAHPNKPKDHYRSRHLQGELNCALLSRERHTSQLKTSKRTTYINKSAKMKNQTNYQTTFRIL